MWLVSTTGVESVGDLITAAGEHGCHISDDRGRLVVDGRVWDASVPLSAIGLHAGSVLGIDDSVRRAVEVTEPLISVTVMSGVSAGHAVSLGAGRFVLGAAPGIALPLVSDGVPHGAVVTVEGCRDHVEVTVTHVAGPPPAIHGCPVIDDELWPPDTDLVVGTHTLRWWRADVVSRSVVDDSVDPEQPAWRVLERRGRVITPQAAVVNGTTDDQTDRLYRPPMVPAALGVLTALVVAGITRHVMFAVFAVSSLVATSLWWVTVMGREHRRRNRRHREVASAHEALAHRLRLTRDELHHVVAIAHRRRPGLWERRPHRHDDTWEVVLGRGAERTPDGVRVDDVPVIVNLCPGARIGLGGGGALALMRSVVAQLITHIGPADLGLQLHGVASPGVSDALAVLPHRVDGGRHHVNVVIDPPASLASLRAATCEAAWIVVDTRDDHDSLDAWCSTTLRWDGRSPSAVVMSDGVCIADLAPAGASQSLFDEVVRAVVAYRDPDLQSNAGGGSAVHGSPPSWAEVTLDAREPDGLRPAAIQRRWSRPERGLPVCVGVGRHGTVVVDLTDSGPHALVAGTTGSGKSELLKTLVLGLAWMTPPQRLQFVLIDYKGGAAFDACTALPHVVGVVTDLDGEMGARVLTGLRAELTRREHQLRATGHLPTHRLVIVVDEFAALVEHLPDLVSSLVAVAQRGRSLGVHMVLATQRPAGVVRDDIRANTDLRLCLRVTTRMEALDVVGDDRPAQFDRRQPGRVLMRCGSGDPVEFQVAATSSPWPVDQPRVHLIPVGQANQPTTTSARTNGTTNSSPDILTIVTAALAEASRELPRPVPLWQAPLPDLLDDAELDAIRLSDARAIGILDDVEHQRHLPLVSDPAGHTIVIGGPRSGVTCTLNRIVRSRPDHRIITLDVAAAVGDALERLVHEVDERRAGRVACEPTTLVIDGLGALRRRWESDLGAAAWQMASRWEHLLADGPAQGVVVVAGADRVASCGPLLFSVSTTRWLMRPLDPMDIGHFGVRPPVDLFGHWPPGRLIDTATGLVGQVALRTPSTI